MNQVVVRGATIAVTTAMSVCRRPFWLSSAVVLALLVVTAPPAIVLLARPERPPRPGALPRARVQPAPELRLSGEVDSNSPALWDLVDGQPQLHVFTSVNGISHRSEGPDLTDLTAAVAVGWINPPQQGVWMEAVVADEAGTWYGYYHNERGGIECGASGKVLPRIGAARTLDRGVTWEDLGPILEAPPDTFVCDTTNRYFHGGVGDLSVMLDPDRQYLYIFYSEYLNDLSGQGVAMARMAWADRDAPAGRVDLWSQQTWLPPTEAAPAGDEPPLTSWIYPAGTPLFATTRSWHDAEGVSDAFWGPSVHWNSYLNQYVMLLNRTSDVHFAPVGIYVSYNEALDQPGQWSTPRLILPGGSWYPQVVGLEPGDTDKTAGQVARLFVHGTSSYYLEFQR
jgi:hypothetical protein